MRQGIHLFFFRTEHTLAMWVGGSDGRFTTLLVGDQRTPVKCMPPHENVDMGHVNPLKHDSGFGIFTARASVCINKVKQGSTLDMDVP